MADKKISELTNITGANLADADEFVVVDTSANETKAITYAELKSGLDTSTGFVRVTGDTMTGNLSFGDNNKAIFGAGSDLQIYHDGLNSVIADTGTGNLLLTANDFRLQNTTQTQNMISANDDGAVGLFYNGSQKLATTSTGVDVTGTVTADGLTSVSATGLSGFFSQTGVTNTNTLQVSFTGGNVGSTSPSAAILRVTSDSSLRPALSINDEHFFRVGSTVSAHLKGDISFYEDTGTTPKFFWDASAEALGIGTSSISIGNDLQLYKPDLPRLAFTNSSATGSYWLDKFGVNARLVNTEPSGSVTISTAGTERLRIDSSGNVGIGTSSPSSKAHISSSVIGYTVPLLVENTNTGTTGAVAHQIKAGSNTAVFGIRGSGHTDPYAFLLAQSNVPLLLGTNDTERLRIDSSGNVGIGTASPSSLLAGANNLVVGSGSGEKGMTIYSGSTSNGNLYFANGTVGSDAYRGFMQYNHSSNYFRIGTAGSERLRIDSSGNLLVGTTVGYNGSAGAHISPEGFVGISRNGLNVAIFNRNTSDGDIVTFRKDNTTVGSIGSYFGDLYIASPSSTDAGLGFGASNIRPVTTTGASRDAAVDLGKSTARFKDLYLSGGISNPAAGGTLTFGTVGSERMRIDSSGRLFVGTTVIAGAGGFTVSPLGSNGAAQVSFNRADTTLFSYPLVFSNNGVASGSISYNNTATSYNTSSDYRLKEDIQPLTGASDRVLALKPSNFAWKADGSRTDGFIAHEVQEVAPYAVTGEKDGEEMQAMDHSKLVPLLTAALQEALKRIDALEAQLNP